MNADLSPSEVLKDNDDENIPLALLQKSKKMNLASKVDRAQKKIKLSPPPSLKQNSIEIISKATEISTPLKMIHPELSLKCKSDVGPPPLQAKIQKTVDIKSPTTPREVISQSHGNLIFKLASKVCPVKLGLHLYVDNLKHVGVGGWSYFRVRKKVQKKASCKNTDSVPLLFWYSRRKPRVLWEDNELVLLRDDFGPYKSSPLWKIGSNIEFYFSYLPKSRFWMLMHIGTGNPLSTTHVQICQNQCLMKGDAFRGSTNTKLKLLSKFLIASRWLPYFFLEFQWILKTNLPRFHVKPNLYVSTHLRPLSY